MFAWKQKLHKIRETQFKRIHAHDGVWKQLHIKEKQKADMRMEARASQQQMQLEETIQLALQKEKE